MALFSPLNPKASLESRFSGNSWTGHSRWSLWSQKMMLFIEVMSVFFNLSNKLCFSQVEFVLQLVHWLLLSLLHPVFVRLYAAKCLCLLRLMTEKKWHSTFFSERPSALPFFQEPKRCGSRADRNVGLGWSLYIEIPRTKCFHLDLLTSREV